MYATVRNCLEILFILGNLLLDSCLQIWEQIGLRMNEFWIKKKTGTQEAFAVLTSNMHTNQCLIFPTRSRFSFPHELMVVNIV